MGAAWAMVGGVEVEGAVATSALLGVFVAAVIGAIGSVAAAVVGGRARSAARSADYALHNGIHDELRSISDRQVLHEARLERIEAKVDTGQARLAGRISAVEDCLRGAHNNPPGGRE